MSGPALRDNNFDLLRFAFAATVMLVHAHVLSGREELAFLSRWLSSDLAVKAFFVVSGLLVFMSWERTRDLAAYAGRRVRRIYPAYFTVVAGAGLLLFLASGAGAADYAAGLARYLAANLVFLNFLGPALPGVFEGNGMREVNGALWTLKIEVMFYLCVPALAWLFRRAGRARCMAALYFLSLAWSWGFEHLARESGRAFYEQVARQLPGQLCYFIAGAACYYYRGWFMRHGWRLAAVAAALLVLERWLPLRVAEPAALGVLVAFFGLFLHAGNFGRYGDFSYGIYILHFPVLQVLVQAGLFAWSPLGALAIACAAVLAAAVALWHLVEKPFLARSSHYVAAARTA